jgi:hypothetical protein
MSLAETPSEKTPGILAENYSEVLGLQSCLARSEPNIEIIPRLLKRIIREHCWQEWLTPEGNVIRWNSADFRLFLTSKRPEGCETPIHVIRRIIQGTDKTLETDFEKLVRGEPGGIRPDQPRSENGTFGPIRNRDPITVADTPPIFDPDVIPFDSPPAKPSRKPRDYSREAPTGTSVSYAVRRLGKERPDLLERVKSGELKPKTAMREAGFVLDEFSIPVEPQSAARRILKRFEGEPLVELIRILANHAGFDLTPRE